jgi:hypothetical protein
MIQITPQMRVVVAVEPADFRKGIDGLARVCKEVLKHDPFAGWVFVFRNRPATAVKLLVYLCPCQLAGEDFVAAALLRTGTEEGSLAFWVLERRGTTCVPAISVTNASQPLAVTMRCSPGVSECGAGRPSDWQTAARALIVRLPPGSFATGFCPLAGPLLRQTPVALTRNRVSFVSVERGTA